MKIVTVKDVNGAAGECVVSPRMITDRNRNECIDLRKRRARSSPVREAGAVCPVVSPQSELGTWHAYYSAQPPASPLRLITMQSRTSGSPCVKLHTTNSQYADVATATPNFPLPRKRNASQNRRRVRSILRDLVANLPTTERPRCASIVCSSFAVAEAPKLPVIQGQDVQVQTDPKCLPELDELYEELASPTCESSGRSSRERDTRGKPEWYPSLAWASGVRELRDAHVTLVLRQLRQLRRLNAAVDNAVAAAVPYRV